MKMKLIAFIILILVSFLAQGAFADSPVTSASFSEAYLDISLVRVARDHGVLTEEMCQFLINLNIALDQKAALINALGWAIEGKKNAVIFSEYLMKKYRFQTRELPLYGLNGSELMCLGYLKLHDDYFHPKEARNILEKALQIKPKSLTVNIVTALARGQVAFETDWCQVWRFAEAVLNDSTLDRDLRPEALQIIIDYLVSYQEYCFE